MPYTHGPYGYVIGPPILASAGTVKMEGRWMNATFGGVDGFSGLPLKQMCL